MNPVTRTIAREDSAGACSRTGGISMALLGGEQAADRKTRYIQEWLDFGQLLPDAEGVSPTDGAGQHEGNDDGSHHHRPRYRRRPDELHQTIPVRCFGNE